MANGANENKRYNHFGLNVFIAPEEKMYRHGNIITQGIPSLSLSVKFLSFFNDFY